MLIVVLSSHGAIPDVQGRSINIILIGSNLPLDVLQKLVVLLNTITFVVCASGKLFEFGSTWLLIEQLLLLIDLP